MAPFAAGEPDFATPAHICEAGIEAIRDGYTRYAPAAGIAPLREAVARDLGAMGYEGLTPDRTIVSVGAKGVLYLALDVLLEPGDEVLVPAPYWLSYPKMIQAAGGTSVIVESRPDAVIDPNAVRRAITPKTRALIVNSPSNPSGAVQPDDVQAELGRIAIEHDLAVISDEIYAHLTYPPARFRSFAALAPEARDRTLVVNGVSKSHAMTGWRIGYGGGPKEWVARMIRLQSHAFTGPPEIAQRAALAALEGPQDAVVEMRDAFARRRDVMYDLLKDMEGVTVHRPDGAFYMFPDVAPWIGRTYEGELIEDDTKLAALLLEHAHAAVVPGGVFGVPTALRFSYACSQADIERGLARVRAFVDRLS